MHSVVQASSHLARLPIYKCQPAGKHAAARPHSAFHLPSDVRVVAPAVMVRQDVDSTCGSAIRQRSFADTPTSLRRVLPGEDARSSAYSFFEEEAEEAQNVRTTTCRVGAEEKCFIVQMQEQVARATRFQDVV